MPSRREREKLEKGFEKVFESVKTLFLKNLKHDVRLIEKQVLSIEPGKGSLNFLNKISIDQNQIGSIEILEKQLFRKIT